MKHLLYLIFLLCICNANAKEYYASSLSKENGLPVNEIFDIYQDKKGFVWIACEIGLVRYDGTFYKIYKSKDLVYAPGSSIVEDAMGRIWYENFDGFLYYVENDTLHFIGDHNNFNYYPIGCSGKHLFQLQKNKVAIYDLKNLNSKQYIRLTDSFYYATAAGDDAYFVLTDQYLYKIDHQLALHKIKKASITNYDVKRLFYSNDRIFLVSAWQQKVVLVLSNAMQPLLQLQIPDDNVAQQCAFIDNHYWIQTFNGIYKFNTSGALVAHLLAGITISKVMKDKQENYWVASNRDGIKIFSDFSNQFLATPNFTPKFIYRFQNELYIIDQKGTFYRTGIDQASSFEKVFTNPNKSPIYYAYLNSSSGTLLYASLGASIVKLPDWVSVQHYNVAIKDVCKVDAKYWAIAANGFYGLMYNPDAKNNNDASVWDALYFRHNVATQTSISKVYEENVRGRAIAFSSANNSIYASGNNGLLNITPYGIKEIFHNQHRFFAQKLFAFGDTVYALDTKGALYKIDTLNRIAPLELSIPNTIQKAKLIDSVLFLSTQQQLYAYHLRSQQVVLIEMPMSVQEVNDFEWYQNVLYILTDKGLLIQNNTHIKNNIASGIIISSVQIAERVWHNYSKIVVPSASHSIQISYAVPNFGSNNKPEVQYKIDQHEWYNMPKGTNVLEIFSLPEGTHTIAFKVNNMIQDEVIYLEVLRPLWKQAWFIGSVLLVVISLSFVVYKKRVDALQKRIGLLEEKVLLEKELGKSIVKSVKAQMNPHFFYNALNTIQAYIYMNDKRNAGKYLSMFSNLTRKILEMSEQEYIILTEEIKTLELYLELEKMRFDKELQTSITLDPDIESDFIRIPTMLVQPFVENAIKHGLLHKKGSCKTLEISFKKVENYLQIVIDDNGVGRGKSAQINSIKFKNHQSFSTEANNKRIEVLNKHNEEKIKVIIEDKYDTNGIASGTTVILIVPVSKTLQSK